MFHILQNGDKGKTILWSKPSNLRSRMAFHQFFHLCHFLPLQLREFVITSNQWLETDQHSYLRVSMGWWLLRLTVKILAFYG